MCMSEESCACILMRMSLRKMAFLWRFTGFYGEPEGENKSLS